MICFFFGGWFYKNYVNVLMFFYWKLYGWEIIERWEGFLGLI